MAKPCSRVKYQFQNNSSRKKVALRNNGQRRRTARVAGRPTLPLCHDIFRRRARGSQGWRVSHGSAAYVCCMTSCRGRCAALRTTGSREIFCARIEITVTERAAEAVTDNLRKEPYRTLRARLYLSRSRPCSNAL